MPPKKPQEDLVGSNVIASLFGVTARRVQQLTKEEIIEAKRVGNANRYEMAPTVQRYIAYLTERAAGREAKRDKETEAHRAKAEADFKRTKADIEELKLRELQGKMHRSEDVEAVMTDLVYTIRSMMMALPGRLAVDTSSAKTAAEASEMIQAEVYEILKELAGYRYDPEIYAKRVRERQGWQENNGDNDDE